MAKARRQRKPKSKWIPVKDHDPVVRPTMAQLKSLEQQLTIREKEIERLKERLEHLESVDRLQIELNEGQREFNEMVRQQLDHLQNGIQALLGIVRGLLPGEEKAPSTPKTGVSEVG
jgi:TolA-binding protein